MSESQVPVTQNKHECVKWDGKIDEYTYPVTVTVKALNGAELHLSEPKGSHYVDFVLRGGTDGFSKDKPRFHQWRQNRNHNELLDSFSTNTV